MDTLKDLKDNRPTGAHTIYIMSFLFITEKEFKAHVKLCQGDEPRHYIILEGHTLQEKKQIINEYLENNDVSDALYTRLKQEIEDPEIQTFNDRVQYNLYKTKHGEPPQFKIINEEQEETQQETPPQETQYFKIQEPTTAEEKTTANAHERRAQIYN